jgi:hypothetical protein
VSLVSADVLEERIASIIRVTRIAELGATYYVRHLLVTANVPSSPILFTLMMEALRPSETSVLPRKTLRCIPKDGIFRSHRREKLRSCKEMLLGRACSKLGIETECIKRFSGEKSDGTDTDEKMILSRVQGFWLQPFVFNSQYDPEAGRWM